MRYVPEGPPPDDKDLPARERELLDLVNDRLATASTLEGVLDALFDDAAPILSCDRIGLAFLDDRGERLTSTHVVARYRPLHLAKGYSAPLSGSSLSAVIARGVPRIIGDLEQYLHENPGSQSSRLAVGEGVRSSLTCPLSVDGRPVGVLFFSSQKRWAFGELEVRLLQAVTERLSRAIERAWWASRVEAGRRACVATLGFVRREIMLPVADLVADARQLRSGSAGPVTGPQVLRLDRMTRRAEELSESVNDYVARVLPLLEARLTWSDTGAPGSPE